MTTRRTLRISIVALVLGGLVGFSSTASSQPMPVAPGSAVFDTWVGSWAVTGNMMGAATDGTVTWSWVLDDFFIQGVEETNTVLPDGTPYVQKNYTYCWVTGEGTFSGHTYLNTGEVIAFEGVDTEGGGARLEFTDPNGSFRWEIDAMTAEGGTAVISMTGEDGVWMEFGTLSYAPAGM